MLLETNPDDGVGLYARRMSAPAHAVLVDTSESETKLLYVQSYPNPPANEIPMNAAKRIRGGAPC